MQHNLPFKKIVETLIEISRQWRAILYKIEADKINLFGYFKNMI